MFVENSLSAGVLRNLVLHLAGCPHRKPLSWMVAMRFIFVFVSMCIICVLKRASPILRPREVVNWGECVSFGSQVDSDER
jgi:hypothetical protein